MLALVAFGIVTAALRRATLFQIVGHRPRRERASRWRRYSCPAAERRSRSSSESPLDLTLVALVAVVFYERIFAEFGTGDSAALEGAA